MEYILPSAWEQFYTETDPKERNALLEAAGRDASFDAAERSAVEEIFRKRHPSAGNPAGEDRFLKEFFGLMEVSQSRKGPGRQKTDILAASQLLRRFGLAAEREAKESTEREKKMTFAYWEIRNAARRYIQTTEGDRYGRKLMGFISPKRAEKEGMAVADIWAVMNGVDQYLKNAALPEIRDALTLIRDAVRDEYYAHDEGARARLDAYLSGHTL